MQLLYSPASPFSRKVRVVVSECGLADRVEMVRVHTSPLAHDAGVARANPLAKIPALVRDDGPTLYDSRVITRYLDALAGGSLYPERRIWEILTLEATADGLMEAAVLMTYERRFREEAARHQGWVDSQRTRIFRTLDALGERWMSHLGGRLDIGAVAVGCALGYLDFRHDDLDWRAGRTALADWYARLEPRESMRASAFSD